VTASLGDVLEWLDGHVNLEAIVAGRASMPPTLDRIARLAGVMGDPQASCPIIHVTGTNGKGSTVRMATSLLMANGLTVGTYTSPHLEQLNERIAWNGDPIPDDELTEVLAALRDIEPFASSVTGLPGETAPTYGRPTWFELMTAAAYRWFADMAVDAAVVEVGLGGRYDATNIADGDVAVVTNVDLDHLELIGPTKTDIASEKAGIVKQGSLLVLGETQRDLVELFRAEAERVGARAVWLRDEDFGCEENRLAHGGRLVNLRTPGGFYEDLFIPLAGAHQGDNAAAALAAAEAFFGAALAHDVVERAFASVSAPGRMEVVGRRPLILLDGAHNVAGARVAGETLAEDFKAATRIVIVMGCLRGRDPAELLAMLADERTERVIGCPAPSPRGMGAEDVVAAAEALDLRSSAADSIVEALDEAMQIAGPEDLVLVTGSLYVVGAARSILRGRPAG
jgi:dihydrofolate synthase/folylpolyglutamate synthase